MSHARVPWSIIWCLVGYHDWWAPAQTTKFGRVCLRCRTIE